jgi:hypothetical protein
VDGVLVQRRPRVRVIQRVKPFPGGGGFLVRARNAKWPEQMAQRGDLTYDHFEIQYGEEWIDTESVDRE